MLGLVGYILPWLLALFGVAHLLNFFSYLRERLQLVAALVGRVVVSLTGLLYMMDGAVLHGNCAKTSARTARAAGSAIMTYGQTQELQLRLFACSARSARRLFMSALCLISLLFLTNFRLGDWIRALF